MSASIRTSPTTDADAIAALNAAVKEQHHYFLVVLTPHEAGGVASNVHCNVDRAKMARVLRALADRIDGGAN